MKKICFEKKNCLRLIADLLCDLTGAVFFSVGLQTFAVPNRIVPGGISGLAALFNYLFSLPIGLGNFLFNLPLLLAAWFLLGRRFTLRTLKSVAILSIVVDFMEKMLPVYRGDRLLGALFGGIFIGTGLAVIFLRGSTTGGSDIAGRLLQLQFPQMQTGFSLLLIDTGVILLSVLVYGDMESGLYGLILVFLSSRVIDTVLYGVEEGKMVLIISKENQKIAREIALHLERGATFLKSKGAYSEEYDSVLLCAVRKNQFYRLKRLVYQLDPKAFLIMTNAGEILGEGFSSALSEK